MRRRSQWPPDESVRPRDSPLTDEHEPRGRGPHLESATTRPTLPASIPWSGCDAAELPGRRPMLARLFKTTWLVDDPVFFAPFFDARIGRPSIPTETYLPIMCF
jgi:hypothetical protein